MKPINSSKNKLNSKNNWLFKPMPNVHSIYFYIWWAWRESVIKVCYVFSNYFFLQKKKKKKISFYGDMLYDEPHKLLYSPCGACWLIFLYCNLFKSMSAIIQEMVSELPLLHNKFQVQIKASTIFGKIQDWY